MNNVSAEHKWWYTFAEIQTKYFISKVLSEDSICIDIGANVGMYSLLFLQLSSSSKVIAFEPSSNFKFLLENIPDKFRNRFQAFKVALGDKNGIAEGEIWESFGHKEVKDNFKFSTLDSFLETNPVERIDMVKIDTDGFETQILRGAVNVLMKFQPLIIIESDSGPESGQSSQVISEMLMGLGYKNIGTLDGNNGIYVHLSQAKKKEIKRAISRELILRKSFLGALVPTRLDNDSRIPSSVLKFTLSEKSKISFSKFFYTNGKPWNYSATSSIIDNGAKYIQISGLILGSDASLVCISSNISNLFMIPLPVGLYSKLLIPLKNVDGASSIRVVVRNGGNKGKALVVGLKVVSNG